MGIFSEQLHSERNTIIKAITKLNPEDLESAIRDGEDIGILRADDDEEYISWHTRRNLLPESDEIDGVKAFRDTLTRGHSILRILAENGIYIDGIGKDYEEYSVVSLKIVESGRKTRVYYDNPKGAMWLAQSPEALKIMLAEGGNVNLKDTIGRTALHYLAIHPEEYFRPDEMMRILFANGAKVIDDEAQSLWYSASVLSKNYNEAPLMRLLIEHGAVLDDEELRDCANVGEFGDDYCDCRKAFIEEMIRLMHKESQLTSSELDLIAAAYSGEASAVSDILSREPNINVNVQTNKWKYTPLMFAAYSDNSDTVSRLINAGAVVDMQNYCGETALREAVINRDYATAELLVQNGADPNIRDNDGETPYTHIFSKVFLESEDMEIAELFLKCGVDVDSLNADGDTPLLACLKKRNMHYRTHMMAEMLLQHGANVNAQDREGMTALMFYNKHNSTEIMKMLLRYGADTSLKNLKGQTALGIFLYKGYVDEDVLALLLKGGVYLGNHVETDDDDDFLMLKAIRSYDAGALRKIIDEDDIRAFDILREIGWELVVNDVPEPEAEVFREKLNKGAEILRMLNELDDIPLRDYRDRELSYVSADWCRFSNAYENMPIFYDALTKQRHAASPMALRKVLEDDSQEQTDDDFPMSDFPMPEEYMEKLSRMFSPEDFVTRDDERRARIRASFTPEDFITCDDDDDEGEDNILHILALHGKNYFDPAGMISVACEHGIDPNALSEDGALPLLLTFWSKSAICAYALLNAGADITKEDSEGETVRAKLNDEDYTNINAFQRQIFFKGHRTAELMFIEVLRTLIYGRGKANNSLIAAALDGDVRKILEVLADGADVNVKSQRGYTPLMLPVFPEKVAVLAELGADLNRKTPMGSSALSAAAAHGKYGFVEALLRAGADPEPLMNEED
ncbi:MAG: ankyrin repeat domain-containing protein [Synergistaceae bacterium]|nr:ankyrin repeat domain-containing protein [Synergistaceae bacterium]